MDIPDDDCGDLEFHVSEPVLIPKKPTKNKKPKPSTYKKQILTWEKMSLGQRIKFIEFKKFFRDNSEMLESIVQIIEGKHKVSKRILEHLVTNFANSYKLVLPGKDGPFVVYEQYRLNLPKKNMDPCRRGPRIEFPFKDRFVETTLQQLESLRWVFTTPIFEYAQKNYDVIKKDLNLAKKIYTKKSTDHIKLPQKKTTSIIGMFPTHS